MFASLPLASSLARLDQWSTDIHNVKHAKHFFNERRSSYLSYPSSWPCWSIQEAQRCQSDPGFRKGTSEQLRKKAFEAIYLLQCWDSLSLVVECSDQATACSTSHIHAEQRLPSIRGAREALQDILQSLQMPQSVLGAHPLRPPCRTCNRPGMRGRLQARRRSRIANIPTWSQPWPVHAWHCNRTWHCYFHAEIPDQPFLTRSMIMKHTIHLHISARRHLIF